MSVKPILLSVGLCSLLLSCGQKSADSFCKSHAKEHYLHRSEITQVNIQYSEEGMIVAEVNIDQQYVRNQELKNMRDIIEVKAERSCTSDEVEIKKEGMNYQARYSLNCGLENKLQKVSVPVLEKIKVIDEVEVFISTPSSSKHFVLSRQCDSPIFNIN